MMTRSGTSERSDFDARRSALMFERHLNRFGRRSKDWAGNIHHGGTFEDSLPGSAPLADGGSDPDAKLARLHPRR